VLSVIYSAQNAVLAMTNSKRGRKVSNQETLMKEHPYILLIALKGKENIFIW
jgi:hypothetical protein